MDSAEKSFSQICAGLLDHLERKFSQASNPEDRTGCITIFATLPVFAIPECVLYSGVRRQDHEIRGEGEMLHREITAIEMKHVPGLPGPDRELIHDPAGNSGVVVFGLLAEKGPIRDIQCHSA